MCCPESRYWTTCPWPFWRGGGQVCSAKRDTPEVRGSLPRYTPVPCWPNVNFVVGALFGFGVTSGNPAGEKGGFSSVETAGRFSSATLSAAPRRACPRSSARPSLAALPKADRSPCPRRWAPPRQRCPGGHRPPPQPQPRCPPASVRAGRAMLSTRPDQASAVQEGKGQGSENTPRAGLGGGGCVLA